MKHYLLPLASKYTTRKFSAGSMILYQGEVPRLGCIVTKGVARVYSISETGDEQIVTFHIAGEFFPASWLFGKSTSTVFFYEALTDCEIAFVPKNDLLAFVYSNESNTRELVDYFATNYAASLIRVNALEQSKARMKLAYTLYFLCERYGIRGTKGLVTMPISLTHQNFAGLVGLTRETAATEMGKFKKDKVINYHNQKYQVNLERLMDIIGEDSFKGITITDDSL
jgi:CRP-like cAMP-binding protein